MRQGTVRTWAEGLGGSAYLDDGTIVELPSDALEGSSFRFLRPGQRVMIVGQDTEVRVDLP